MAQGNQDYPLVCCEQGGPGCAGLVVNKVGRPGATYLLSAAHVLSTLPGKIPSVGDPVFSVQNFDGDNPRRIGELTEWIEIASRADRRYMGDLALASLSVPISTVVPGGIGVPKGVSTTPLSMGDEIRIFSMTANRILRSQVDDPAYSGELEYPDGNIHFRNVVRCKPPYSEPGDSGGVVLNDRNEVVGINFWGGPNESIFAPIGNALRHFGVEMFTGAVSPAVTSSSAPAGAPSPAPPVGNAVNALDVMARTLFGEARGEGDDGITAVGCVIANRARHRPGFWWGDTVESVCRKPSQFTCWNDDDPNLPQLKSVTLSDPHFAKCHAIAQEILAGRVADTTSKATHYHTAGVSPAWSSGREPCAVIGHHRFFNNIG